MEILGALLDGFVGVPDGCMKVDVEGNKLDGIALGSSVAAIIGALLAGFVDG